MSEFFDKAAEDMKASLTSEESQAAADEWNPTSEGEALRCVFIKAWTKDTRYGPGINVLVKDVDTDLYVKVWAKRSMLKQQLLDAAPAVGSPTVFVYNGQREGANGYPFHSYQVRTERSDDELWKKVMTAPPEPAKAKPITELTYDENTEVF